MSKLKVIWNRPQVLRHTGWARTCIALAAGRGARAIVGEYLTEGELLIEEGTLIVEVSPWCSDGTHAEEVRILRVAPSDYAPSYLIPATARTYRWRTEHVSLREKLAELLAADCEGADIGDGTEHEREYLTELERMRHYLRRAYIALAEIDDFPHVMLSHTDGVRIGDLISAPLAAIRQAYPHLEGDK